MAPTVLATPRGPDQEEDLLIESSVPKERSARKRMLITLQEAEERFRHELLDDEERLLLRDRIIRLKKKLASLAAS